MIKSEWWWRAAAAGWRQLHSPCSVIITAALLHSAQVQSTRHIVISHCPVQNLHPWIPNTSTKCLSYCNESCRHVQTCADMCRHVHRVCTEAAALLGLMSAAAQWAGREAGHIKPELAVKSATVWQKQQIYSRHSSATAVGMFGGSVAVKGSYIVNVGAGRWTIISDISTAPIRSISLVPIYNEHLCVCRSRMKNHGSAGGVVCL